MLCRQRTQNTGIAPLFGRMMLPSSTAFARYASDLLAVPTRRLDGEAPHKRSGNHRMGSLWSDSPHLKGEGSSF